jgi:hypothetical protein
MVLLVRKELTVFDLRDDLKLWKEPQYGRESTRRV